MKKTFGSISLLGILVLSGCGSSLDVVEYNDNFVALVKECTDASQTLFQSFNAEGASIDSITQELQNNIVICQNTQAEALKVGDYDGDSSLKDGVVNLLALEVDYLQKFASTSRYRNIDNLTEEDKEAYNGVVNDLNQSQSALNQGFINLQDIQEAFAVKHHLKLE